MVEKRAWLTRHADHLRRALLLEPRGHADMCAAILTEAVSPGSHAGVVFMERGARRVTVQYARRMVGRRMYGGASTHIPLKVNTGGVMPVIFAGTIRARANVTAERRVASVSLLTFHPLFCGGVVVTLGARRVRADVAYGGVLRHRRRQAVGLPIDGAHLAELRRTGVAIAKAVEEAHPAVHPADAGLGGIAGTIFTGPPRDERAALRNTTVFADGRVDRSPSGTGTAAVMAVLDAMGMLGSDVQFVHASLIGTLVTGLAGERWSVTTRLSCRRSRGSAWITGEHLFVIDEDDRSSTAFACNDHHRVRRARRDSALRALR
jgi:proline racemase